MLTFFYFLHFFSRGSRTPTLLIEKQKKNPNFFSFFYINNSLEPVLRLVGLAKYVFFFLKEKTMQNFLKRINMYLEGFQVILNFFPQNNTLKTILNLLICLSKKENVRMLRTCPQLLFFLRLSSVQNIYI